MQDNDMQDSGMELSEAIKDVANAIMPIGAAGGQDEAGGHVQSLTESIMGGTAGLCLIAGAIGGLADAMREAPSKDVA